MFEELRTEYQRTMHDVQLEREEKEYCQPVMYVAENGQNTYDFQRWKRHRSPSRYYTMLYGILGGVTSKRILPVLVALIGFTVLVCIYQQACLENPNLVTVQLPLTPFELTAPALGLLLVFRSDNAYGRFKEGSELAWEITTSIRSAMRRLLAWTSAAHIPESERLAAKELIHGCCLLHGWIMNEHLRCSDDSCPVLYSHEDLLTAALGPGAFDAREDWAHGEMLTPYLGIEALSAGASQRLPSLTDQELIAFDESLATVTEDLGKCEALLRTPIPLGYTRSIVRFLWVWLSFLPFALTRAFCGFQAGTWWEGKVDEPWPLVVASVGLIAAIFLSIEDIAIQHEEPFAVLPLGYQHDWLCRDLAISQRLLGRRPRRQLDDAVGSVRSTAATSSSRAVRGPPRMDRVGDVRLQRLDRLQELKELRDAGQLTEYEYYRQRQAELAEL